MSSCCFYHLFQCIGFDKCAVSMKWIMIIIISETFSKHQIDLSGEVVTEGPTAEREVEARRDCVERRGEKAGSGIVSCSTSLHHCAEGTELTAIISETSGELPEKLPLITHERVFKSFGR